MKKFLYSLGLLICLAASAHAGSGLQTTQVFKTTSTTDGASLISEAAVTPSNLMADSLGTQFTYVSIQNNQGGFSLFCAERPDVTTSGPLKGYEIVVGVTYSRPLVAGGAYFCVHDGAPGTVRPTITRGK